MSWASYSALKLAFKAIVSNDYRLILGEVRGSNWEGVLFSQLTKRNVYSNLNTKSQADRTTGSQCALRATGFFLAKIL